VARSSLRERARSHDVSGPLARARLEIEFDLVRHVLEIRSSLGQTASIALASRPVAHFFRDYLAALDAFGVRVRFLRRPVEVRESIPFEQDLKQRTYDPEWANSFWRVLVEIRNVFERFRGEFIGKASPVHFFWVVSTLPRRASPAGVRRSIREASPTARTG
jgi:hypothetical protein